MVVFEKLENWLRNYKRNDVQIMEIKWIFIFNVVLSFQLLIVINVLEENECVVIVYFFYRY